MYWYINISRKKIALDLETKCEFFFTYYRLYRRVSEICRSYLISIKKTVKTLLYCIGDWRNRSTISIKNIMAEMLRKIGHYIWKYHVGPLEMLPYLVSGAGKGNENWYQVGGITLGSRLDIWLCTRLACLMEIRPENLHSTLPVCSNYYSTPSMQLKDLQ